METYDFEVLRGDETVAAVHSIKLPNSKAVWPQVAELAKQVYEPGCRIRVTNRWGRRCANWRKPWRWTPQRWVKTCARWSATASSLLKRVKRTAVGVTSV